MELPSQIHIPKNICWDAILRPSVITPHSPELLAVAEQSLPYDKYSANKYCKPKGGFWTSSQNEDGFSAWLNHCSSYPELLPGRFDINIHGSEIGLFAFKVKGDPNILHINSPRDLVAAMKKAGVPVSDAEVVEPMQKPLRPSVAAQFWPLAVNIWDAVHVRRNFSGGLLAAWSIESTVWFRPQLHLSQSEPARKLKWRLCYYDSIRHAEYC